MGDDAATLSVTYSVPSDATNSSYPLTIEFYLADADGEEGQTLIGRIDYPVSEAGQQTTAAFSPQAAVANGADIVATAIDAAGNTSEFSEAVAANGSAGPDRVFSDDFETRP